MTNPEYFRKIIDCYDEPTFLLERFKVLVANRSAFELFGVCERLDIFDFLLTEEIQRLREKLLTNENFREKTRLFIPSINGWKDYEFTYFRDTNLLILKDLTKEQNLQEAKMNFSIMVSHELKNPLGSIKANLSELLESETDEGKIKKYYFIQKDVERIERILQQIEYIVMVQLGLYEPKVDTINTKKLIKEILSDLEIKIKSKSVNVKTLFEDEDIKSDYFVIKTIITNLLSNAIKYSHEDSEIEILLSQKRLIVKDQGIGMHSSEIDKIFQRFYRTDIARKKAPGSGLGLAVVKYLCDLMGYKVVVESKYLKGTTVTVFLKNTTQKD